MAPADPLRFHSSREERLARPRAPAARSGGFGRKRTLLLLFADILLFLLVGVLLVRFLYAQTPRARLEGYAVSLRGLADGEVVHATLSVRRERGGGQAGDGRIHARLALSAEAMEEAAAAFLSAPLPGAGQGELVLRESLPAKDAKTLYARVRIGQTVRQLSCGL